MFCALPRIDHGLQPIVTWGSLILRPTPYMGLSKTAIYEICIRKIVIAQWIVGGVLFSHTATCKTAIDMFKNPHFSLRIYWLFYHNLPGSRLSWICLFARVHDLGSECRKGWQMLSLGWHQISWRKLGGRRWSKFEKGSDHFRLTWCLFALPQYPNRCHPSTAKFHVHVAYPSSTSKARKPSPRKNPIRLTRADLFKYSTHFP